MEQESTGVQAQEVAAPETNSVPESAVVSDKSPEPATQGTEAPKAEQTPEQRRQFAAARRQQQEAAHKAELKAVQDRYDSIAKEAGFESMAHMQQIVAQQKFSKGEIPTNTLLALIAPKIEEAVAAKYEKTFGAVQQSLDEQDAARELSEFIAEYPDSGIKSYDDFAKMPKSKEFSGYIDKGLSLVEAYELANRQELNAKRVAAAKQATLNSVNSTAHMKPTPGGADGISTTIVDEETKRWYRAAYPGITDKQISERYEKIMKGS